MVLEMLKDQRFDQAAKSAAHGGGLLEDGDAIDIIIDGALESADLPIDAADPGHKFGLVSGDMGHGGILLRRRVGSH